MMWGNFKDGILKASYEVCGKKRRRISKGDTWWWNGEVKEAVPRKKDAHKVMCWNSTGVNKRRYESMKNKAKKAVSKAMREKAEEALTGLQNCPNRMFRLLKRLKTDSNEVEGGRCMRGSDEKLCFREKERGIFWKVYMESIMNEENDWNHDIS